MVTPEQVKQYIAAGLTCEVLEVSGDGHHFEAIIVAKAFDGLPRIRQHQMVYQVLGERMREEIHALSMKTFSPHEWKNRP
ncbi:BolA family protein [Chitinimonas sp. PSY-7]|uniref:BolA/IbaG family iron-sulfur metabolism protein n=1 Tax=Chitinimonas sp. PSY-7 TaxID=3459088 RepID=UPI0040400EB0